MVDQRVLNERRMVIFAIIPFWPLQLYAFSMIEKARKFGLILAGLVGISILTQMILPFPYGLAIALPITILIPRHFMMKWVKQWNAKFSSSLNP